MDILKDFYLVPIRHHEDVYLGNELAIGIDNLFDADPPLGGGNPSTVPYATLNTYQSNATYDPLGRRFYVGLSLKY